MILAVSFYLLASGFNVSFLLLRYHSPNRSIASSPNPIYGFPLLNFPIELLSVIQLFIGLEELQLKQSHKNQKLGTRNKKFQNN